MKVTIITTGVANTASVQAAFRRLDAECELTTDPQAVRSAESLVLPGVGSFGAGMEMLEQYGLADALRERIAAGRKTLAVCLGLQLLAEASEETPGVKGLGIVAAQVQRFTGEVRVPQLGWNDVIPDARCRLLQRGFAYYANSFCLRALASAGCARSEYGEPFIAAFELPGLLACQFHPELSGAWGLSLLGRWLQQGVDSAV